MGGRKTKTQQTKRNTLIYGMFESEVLQAFETLAQTLGVKVRYDKGDFKSALCRVKDDNLIVIQKDIPAKKKIKIFAREFAKIDLNNIYVVPALKKIMQEEMQALNAAEEVK